MTKIILFLFSFPLFFFFMHRRHLLTSFSPLPLLHKGSMKWVDMHIRIKVYNCEKLKKKKEAVLLLYLIKKHSTVSISPVKSKNDSKRKIEKDKLIDTQTYTHTEKKKKGTQAHDRPYNL